MKPINELFLVSESITPPLFLNTKSRVSRKSTPVIARVNPNELELTYLNNGLIFNSINKLVQTMFNWGEFIIEADDPELMEFMDKFTSGLGSSGSLITWPQLLEEICLNSCIFGKSFVENIFNKKGNRIVDWDIVNTKSIDYAKDTNGNIVLNNNSSPVGYFQTLPDNYSDELPEQILPDDVVAPMTSTNYLFIEAKRLAQIQLFKVGDGFYPVGLVETIYRDNVRKLNIKETVANSADWHGYPILHAKLGDMQHPPNAQQIEDTLEVLENLRYTKEICTPYNYDLNMIESGGESFKNARVQLDLFEDEEIAGLGVPKAIAKNLTDGSGTAVMRQLMMTFHLTIKDVAKRVAIGVRREMFAPLVKLEGFKEVPRLVYKFNSPDELDIKARRLLKYKQAGLLEPDESISNMIKEMEGLKTGGKDGIKK